METIINISCGIIGVIAGSYIVRHRDHDKWIIEKRAEAFTSFLQLISQAHRETTDIIHDKSIEETIDRDIKITEAYMPMLNQARIVCLYLPKDTRSDFFKLACEYWSIHSTFGPIQEHITPLEERMKNIQRLFESQIAPKFWPQEIICKLATRLCSLKRKK